MKHSLSKYLAAFAAATMVLSPAFALATDAGAPLPGAGADGSVLGGSYSYDDPSVCDPASGQVCLKTTLTEGAGSVVDLVVTITNWLFTFLLLLAVMFFVLAAYKYLTSGGGEEVSSAHKMVVYGAVAVAVAALAQGIVFVVKKLVGAE